VLFLLCINNYKYKGFVVLFGGKMMVFKIECLKENERRECINLEVIASVKISNMSCTFLSLAAYLCL
jgi:hypothetical protein